MHPRQLGIVVIAVVAAFGVAFGVGKATSSKASPVTGGSVKSLEVSAAPSVGTITTGAVGKLKAIRAPKPERVDKAPDPGTVISPTPDPVTRPRRDPAPDPPPKRDRPDPKPTPPPDEGGGETPREGGGES